jgi:hypothetical protein
MDEIDALLDALWTAAIRGDTEAAIFLQMFAPWASGPLAVSWQTEIAEEQAKRMH